MILYVDTHNLYKHVRRHHRGMKIDYKKYLNRFGEPDVAVAYGLAFKGSKEFINSLVYEGYETEFSPTYKNPDGTIDYERSCYRATMTMDILSELDGASTLVLGSSSADFVGLVEEALRVGVHVIIYACNIDNKLRDTGAEIIEVGEEVAYAAP